MEKIDWVGAQGEYKFSDADHIGGHGGFYQWQYTKEGTFKFVRDLNAEQPLDAGHVSPLSRP